MEETELAAICIPCQRLITGGDCLSETVAGHNDQQHDGQDVAEVRPLTNSLVDEVYEHTELDDKSVYIDRLIGDDGNVSPAEAIREIFRVGVPE